jgi:hypothetical protein
LELRRAIPWGVIREFQGSTTFLDLGNTWTYVAIWGGNESLVPVLNPTSLREAGTRVLLAKDPRSPHRWKIIGIDDSSSSETSGIPFERFGTSVHANNHQVIDESSPGPDPLYVALAMMLMLKTVGDGATLTVSTYEYVYNQDGVYSKFSGASTDLTSYVPVVANKIRSVLLYLDRATNVLSVVAGTIVSDILVPPDPLPPSGVDAEISCWITLVTGQSTITTYPDIKDGRDFLGSGTGSLPEPTEIGQLLMYLNGGVQWVTPVISEDDTWMVNDDGELVVVG